MHVCTQRADKRCKKKAETCMQLRTRLIAAGSTHSAYTNEQAVVPSGHNSLMHPSDVRFCMLQAASKDNRHS
jgi:hypothetical protein